MATGAAEKLMFIVPHAIGDYVVIDRDTSMVCRVTAYTFRSNGALAEVGYVHNGLLSSDWVDLWRLSPAA